MQNVFSTIGTINSNFMKSIDKQKYCKIYIDEIHMKPETFHQGNYDASYSSNHARSVFATMIAPVIGAILVPLYSIEHEILLDQKLKLINSILQNNEFFFPFMSGS